MHIFVDADACPVVGSVEKIANKYKIPVTLLCDTNHILSSRTSEIRIIGASDRLNNVYRYLKRYGYEEKEITYNNGKVKNVMYKEIV